MKFSLYANFSGAAFGFLAAYFWYQAATVKFPLKMHAFVVDPVAVINMDEFSKAILESAKKNKIAAFFSAISVICAAAGSLFDAIYV